MIASPDKTLSADRSPWAGLFLLGAVTPIYGVNLTDRCMAIKVLD